MKIGIIGAGAMGSLFSYYLSRSGNEVVLYEKDKETVEAIKKGLNFEISGRTETISVPISSSSEILKDSRYVFVFVKSYATAGAIKDARPFITGETRIISLQNGLGNEETIKEMAPDNILLYGTTTSGASKAGISTVKFGGAGEILIGGDTSAEELNAAIEFLSSAGFSVSPSEKPNRAVWRKAIINAGINPLGALLDIPNGEIIKNEHSLRLQRSIVDEAVEVARAQGISFDSEEMRQDTKNVCEKTKANICSMLQDVKNRRHTEIESITGEIIAAGKKHGIATPVNESLYLLIKALESIYLMH